MAKGVGDKKPEVIQALRESIKKYGVSAGPKLVREQYPEIPRPTWYRWLKEVAASPLDAATSEAKKAAKFLPAAPSPAYFAEKPAEAKRNIDFFLKMGELHDDAEKLRRFSVTTSEGEEKVKIPTLFGQSIKLRADLLVTYLKAQQQIWDLQRMQNFYDMILEEIGRADPETQKRIVERLQDLNDKTGMTTEMRL